MKWRKPKAAACKVCGVLFEPPKDKVPNADMCSEHRGAANALQVRKDAVAAWAAKHWEALEPLSKVIRSGYGSGLQTVSNDCVNNMQNIFGSGGGSAPPFGLSSPGYFQWLQT